MTTATGKTTVRQDALAQIAKAVKDGSADSARESVEFGNNRRQRTETGAGAVVKPLFIPLKTEYFEAFKAGTKDTEYRRHGQRWNEDTCQIGRPVVLSKGYGKAERLPGVISGFDVRFLRSDDFVACYGEQGWAACIQISLTHAVTGNEG